MPIEIKLDKKIAIILLFLHLRPYSKMSSVNKKKINKNNITGKFSNIISC